MGTQRAIRVDDEGNKRAATAFGEVEVLGGLASLPLSDGFTREKVTIGGSRGTDARNIKDHGFV